MLGTHRRRDLPLGMALRGYYTSDRHDDLFIESHLDIRDAEGNVVPGYGWIFPMGDGRVNVGVGAPFHRPALKGVNTSHLMETFVEFAPKSWGLTPETCLGPPSGGKLPMGLSIGPRAGAQCHPWPGMRRDRSTRSTAKASPMATRPGGSRPRPWAMRLSGEGAPALSEYDRQLQAAYGPYYKVARALRAA